jgi:general secretion pathway protein A
VARQAAKPTTEPAVQPDAKLATNSAAGTAPEPMAVTANQVAPPVQRLVRSAGREPPSAVNAGTEDATGTLAGTPLVAARDEAVVAVGAYAPSPEALPEPSAPLDSGWLERQHAAAWQAMAGLWGDADSAHAIQSACEGAARTGFACIRDHGNWSRIRQLGLPVLLVLHGESPRLLVLQGFGNGKLLVGAGDQARSVMRDAVEEQWLGEYYVTWPQAPDWPTEIRRGESGTAVDIVLQMAERAEPAWLGGGEFDAEFESWLTTFQRRNGLKPDGIIGPNTLIHLMAPTITGPRLVQDSGGSS